MKKIVSFLCFLLVAGLINSIAQHHGVAPAYSAAIGLLGAFVFAMWQRHTLNGRRDCTGIMLNGDLDTQVWLPRIEKQLFANNAFLLRSTDQSEHVNNLTVHIPIEADAPEWDKNLDISNGQPANATDREDTRRSYNIDQWTSKMMRVTNLDKVQKSYPKMDSIVNQAIKKGRNTIANDMIYNWGATGQSGNILRTSGIWNNEEGNIIKAADAPANATVAAGATPNRNVFGLYDMALMSKLFDNWDIPEEGRCCGIPANMYYQLVRDMTLSKYRDASTTLDLKRGIISNVMGWDIYKRSSFLTYTNAGTPVKKAVGAAASDDDNLAALFWHPDYVARAIGENEVYYNPGQAAYLGDVIRFLVRAGGATVRNNEIGVAAMVQAH